MRVRKAAAMFFIENPADEAGEGHRWSADADSAASYRVDEFLHQTKILGPAIFNPAGNIDTEGVYITDNGADIFQVESPGDDDLVGHIPDPLRKWVKNAAADAGVVDEIFIVDI